MVETDVKQFQNVAGVEKVISEKTPYKLVSREFKAEDTVVTVGNAKLGGKHFAVIAGPCAVENREFTLESAQCVKEAGATFLRGGAYKPRTNRYSFQGLGEEGLKILRDVGDEVGLPVVSEMMSPEDLELFETYVDVIQIGARNVRNYSLLKAAGKATKPVLLKRGFGTMIVEYLGSAEYIYAEGNENVILCERGIRTFETSTRNTLDITAVPVCQELSHLPIIIDPSHSTGRKELVEPVSKAAIAIGANGLLIDVHPHPEKALCDGPQALLPDDFRHLMLEIKKIADAVGREI